MRVQYPKCAYGPYSYCKLNLIENGDILVYKSLFKFIEVPISLLFIFSEVFSMFYRVAVNI